MRSLAGLAVAGLLAPFAVVAAPLDPATIPHFVQDLWVPPVMKTATAPAGFDPAVRDYYEIAVKQHKEQVLPTGFPTTTIWSFGQASEAANTYGPISKTILAKPERKVRVKWINGLQGYTYPASIPIDQGKHWANPPGPPDTEGQSSAGTYTGPPPITVHLHGAHTDSESDGIPESWWLPAGGGEPYTRGSDFDQTHQPPSPPREDGAATFEYRNTQAPSTLFWHDHTLGITAENIKMGMAGGYVLKGSSANFKDLPDGQLPFAAAPGDCLTPLLPPAVNRCFDVPLVIVDRSFDTNGDFSGGDDGNTMLVNGRVWPKFAVEPRRYRFRIVDSTNSVFLSLSFANTGRRPLTFTQIGNDGGYLPQQVPLRTLNMRPGERADVIVDFTGRAGQHIVLASDGDVMRFDVAMTVSSPDTTTDPATTMLALLPPDSICHPAGVECATNTRSVAVQGTSLGTVSGSGSTATGHSLLWDSPITENPTKDAIEIWNIYNFGGEPHPIHLHEVQFEVVGRTDISTGQPRPVSANELGRKDTVLSSGHQIVTVRAQFNIGGLFAWHCHMTSHEDDEMMRPLCVVSSVPGDPVCNAH